MVAGEAMFVPSAWPLVSRHHHISMLVVSALPYLYLYLSASSSSTITPASHRQAMQVYPYDHVLFHPGYVCRTCHFHKPARSKHCSICKGCIEKQDHHCIWINNCVGRNNYIWFLLLLLTTSALLLYGACLGFSVLDATLQARFVPPYLVRGSVTAKRWSTKLSWMEWLDRWAWVVGMHWPIGAPTLLAAMSFPLGAGFLGYHIYLLWAGMTTNESSKWADWRDDIADGLVYRAAISSLRAQYPRLPPEIEPQTTWPVESKWWVVLTDHGEPPTLPHHPPPSPAQSRDENGAAGLPDPRWSKVRGISDVENIYDLGFWSNLGDVLFNRAT